MNGLPRVQDTTRPRDVFEIMVLGPVERMTDSLRRGDAFGAQALAEMEQLQRRLRAFDAALTARIQAAQQVIEE